MMKYLAIIIALFSATFIHAAQDVHLMERTSFWVENYTRVNENSSPNASAAYRIFNALLHVAGHHPDKFPRLILIKEDPYNTPLPVALPDGGIILSENIINSIFKTQQFPEAYLAFILGHEIAHVNSQSFIHIKFFRKLDNKLANKEWDNSKKEFVKYELYADEQGIMYAVLAGYNPQHIVNIKNKYSLIAALNKYSPNNKDHLTPLVSENERQNVITGRLNKIYAHANLFTMGMAYFLAGNYSDAIRIFELLKQYYPSRELMHDLGMSYHFHALEYYSPAINEKAGLPFKYSYIIDPYARILNNTKRSPEKQDKQKYIEFMKLAIMNYEQSIAIDPDYMPAYINLSTAYLSEKDTIYKGIGLLMDANKRFVSDDILNNLGIAFMLVGDKNKAQSYFSEAANKSNYAASIYNLALLDITQDDKEQAERLWQQFNRSEPNSVYAQLLADYLDIDTTYRHELLSKESVPGLDINTELNITKNNIVTQKSYNLNKHKYSYTRLNTGLEIVTQNNRIKLVIAGKPYDGHTIQKTMIGDSKETLYHQYGTPAMTLKTPSGMIYNYQSSRIAFMLENNVVKSWIIYE